MINNEVISVNLQRGNKIPYTTATVYEHWVTLNSTSDDMQRKKANSFLLHLKNQKNIVDICTELITSYDEATQLFAANVLFNHINDKISEIAETKDMFNKYKGFLLSQIFPKLKLNSHLQEKISMNICSAITIFVLMGKIKYWPESIEDVIEMSKTSSDNNIFSSMILSNIHYAFTKMKVSERDIKEMKDSLRFSFDIVNEYILNLYNIVKSNNNNNTQNQSSTLLFQNLVNIAFSFADVGDNILTISDIVNYFLTSMPNYDNSIQQLISDCLSIILKKTKNANIYYRIKLDNSNNNNNYMQLLLSQCDQNEIVIVGNLINMIYNLYANYSSVSNILAITTEQKEILFHTANIFSSICSYYIYLMFNLDDISSKMIEIYSFFIKCPILKVSSLFFHTIDEMKTFLDRYFKLNTYNENQKLSFMQFIFSLSDAIMMNTKLKNLNVNLRYLEKNKHTNNLSKLTLFSMLNDINDDTDIISEDISLSSYRQNAKEAYYDLFLIIKYMFNNYGVEQYLTLLGEKLMKSPLNNIKDNSNEQQISNDYLILVEAVLFNVDSLQEIFDLPDMDCSMLLNFCTFILQSQLLSNQRIMLSFISFLYSLYHKIHKDKFLYEESIKFLLQQSTNELLQGIVTLIIKLIIENASKETVNGIVYEHIYQFLLNNYNSLYYISAGNIIEALIRSKIYSNVEPSEICSVIKCIKDVMMMDYNSQQNGTQQQYLSLEKLIVVTTQITKIIGTINDEMLNVIYCKEYANDNMNFIFNFSDMIINTYYNDKVIMSSLTSLYIFFANGIKTKSDNYFDEINNVIFTLYAKNNTIYTIIHLMKIFYEQILTQTNNIQRKQLIAENFFIICNQIKTNCISLSHNSNILVESISSFASFFNSMIKYLPYINLNVNDNYSNLYNIISFLVDCNKTIITSDMNTNIIKSISTLYKSQLLPQECKDKITNELVLVSNNWIYSNIDVYNNNSFALMLLDIYNCNKELFVNIVKNTFKFGEIISDYFILYASSQDNVNKISDFIKEMIDVCKEGQRLNENIFIKKYQIMITQSKQSYDKYKHNF